MTALELVARIERKHAGLPAFVVVPAHALAAWKLGATTTVEGTLDGVSFGRRSLKRWDDARWFIELRQDFLAALEKAPGASARLVLALASTAIPAELQRLVEDDARARARWEECTEAQRRMLREEVLAAKSPAARERRARKALLPAAKAAPPSVAGLGTEPRTLCVRIVGKRLPGRRCGPYSEITVALAQKTGREPIGVVSADAREARWETSLEVRATAGVASFRGPAVNGPPRERFLYLEWCGRSGAAAPARFRRAKLRLDAVPPAVLSKALRTGLLVGTLDLTAPDGMPVCASVCPPAIRWASA